VKRPGKAAAPIEAGEKWAGRESPRDRHVPQESEGSNLDAKLTAVGMREGKKTASLSLGKPTKVYTPKKGRLYPSGLRDWRRNYKRDTPLEKGEKTRSGSFLGRVAKHLTNGGNGSSLRPQVTSRDIEKW